MASHGKPKRERTADYESQIKEIRGQLTEQVKCLDAQVDFRQQLLQDMSEFLRRKAEINLEYSRSLEKLSDRFSAKIRNSKEHHGFRKEQQHLLSPVNCWYMILNHTRQESRDYAALSDVYTTHLIPRLAHIGEDLARLTKKSKDIGAQQQEDLMKLMSELQGAVKTYQLYHNDCLNSEHKLREAEKQEEKRTGKVSEQTASSPVAERGPRRSSLKKTERLVEKRLKKYLENSQKCTKARNEYLINLNSVNSNLNNYYIHDVSDLIDCCDLGFHLSMGKTLRVFLQAEDRVQTSRQHGLQAIEGAVDNIDAQADKNKIMEMRSDAFCPPARFEFQPHEGDEVFEVRSEPLFHQELVSRFQHIQSRLEREHLETEEVNKTLKATLQSLLDLIGGDDYDLSDAFQSSQSTESLKSTGSDTSSKTSTAKRRANQQDTENFYVTKLQKYVAGRGTICKLQAKRDRLKEAIDKAESHNKISGLQSNTSRSQRVKRQRPSSQYNHKLFNGDMEEFVKSSGEAIPRVVSSCIRFINLHGLQHEGIFRVPGSQAQVNEIRSAFERGEDPLDSSYSGNDVDSVAGVLKLYFRGLEKPLFPNEMFNDLLYSLQLETQDRVAHLKKLVSQLPPIVTLVLRYLFAFLNHLSQYSDENMMDPYNLAVCFGPTLVSIPEGQDPVSVQAHVNEVVKTIIIYQERIFPGQAELEGPVYEKCMTVEEDEEYCDTLALEATIEESDQEMHQEMGVSEDELDTVEATAKFEYSARTPQELSFKKGDILLLHSKASGDWWRGELSGMRGLVPHKYISIPEGAQKKLEQRALRKDGDTGTALTPDDILVEPSRIRVNSDSACSPRKRSEGSPIRKLNSPFMEAPRLPFPIAHSGSRLLGHIERVPGERRNLIDITPKGGSAIKTWQTERQSIEVDKDVTKNMNNVFKELLGKAVLRQGVLDEAGDAAKVAKSRENKPTAPSSCDAARGSPAGKKGHQGRAVFGTRR
ncbi:PREDICTED: rho GTPase-activating protein 4 isoform X2 [Nanorana parkeri]|uniref:rho GTPase-activating protein 4 isoform X2 n=1 Tax=Nanorana parkeri TaxID=125878 RepID=UPI000854D0A2|nr:PREDICTED: rho GTPase-activating protein 4 isoform X2 [Nanorana parkeri]